MSRLKYREARRLLKLIYESDKFLELGLRQKDIDLIINMINDR